MKITEFRKLIREEVREALNESKTGEFEIEIINKNGKNTIQKVKVNPASTELFDIIANLKKSPNVKDVKILEKANKK